MAKPTRTIRYTAPVYVTVRDGRISRVIVDDENAKPDEEIPPDVLEILETEEWPAWEFGL